MAPDWLQSRTKTYLSGRLRPDRALFFAFLDRHPTLAVKFAGEVKGNRHHRVEYRGDLVVAMGTLGKALVAGAVALGALGVRTYVVRDDAASATNGPPLSSTTLAHFDHRPRHGGLVLMNGDTHFEVALDRSGRCVVYFSDGIRTPLPAAFASAVSVVVASTVGPRETIALQADPTGASWTGRGATTDDPNAIVRVAYTADDKPYWVDVPVSAWPDAVISSPRR